MVIVPTMRRYKKGERGMGEWEIGRGKGKIGLAWNCKEACMQLYMHGLVISKQVASNKSNLLVMIQK